MYTKEYLLRIMQQLRLSAGKRQISNILYCQTVHIDTLQEGETIAVREVMAYTATVDRKQRKYQDEQS